MAGFLSNLSQNILANLIAYIIMVLVAGLIAWGKKKDWKWTTPLLYGLASFTFIGIILFLLGGIHIDQGRPISKDQNIASLSPKELEIKLRQSLDSLGLGYAIRSETDANALFIFVVKDINGVNQVILQPKKNPSTIRIMSSLIITQDLQGKIDKLSAKDQARLFREIRTTIDRQGILRTSSIPSSKIDVEDFLLIEDLQNLSLFMQKVRSMFILHYSLIDVISSFTEK
jgi:hypothetical protein